MCTVLLPPGVNPIAVNKSIIYHIIYIISYHITSYHTIYHISHHIIYLIRGERFFSFPYCRERLWGPLSPLLNGKLGALSWEVKHLGRQADYLHPSRIEVKNEWHYTATPRTPSWRAQRQFHLLFKTQLQLEYIVRNFP